MKNIKNGFLFNGSKGHSSTYTTALSRMHRHLEPRVLSNLVSSVMMGQIFLDALLYFAMVHRSWQYVNAIHEFSVKLDFHAEYIYTGVGERKSRILVVEYPKLVEFSLKNVQN